MLLLVLPLLVVVLLPVLPVVPEPVIIPLMVSLVAPVMVPMVLPRGVALREYGVVVFRRTIISFLSRKDPLRTTVAFCHGGSIHSSG